MTLFDYCKKKKIRIADLANITGVNISYLYVIANNPNTNVSVGTIDKIYQKTKKKYGKGLTPYEYLNVSESWQK